MVGVDFSITGVPCHILVTAPTPQHTPFGVKESVMQGQMPLLVKSELVLGKGFSSFRGRLFCVSAALNAAAAWEKRQFPYQRSCATTPQRAKGRPVCAWGSAADQTLSRQPLFAQLPCSEKSPEVVGCPVQFASLSFGWQFAPLLKYHSGATLPPFNSGVDSFVLSVGQNCRPERLNGKLNNFSWLYWPLWLVSACSMASKPALPWKWWIYPFSS